MLDGGRPKPVSYLAGCLWPVARPGLLLDCPAARKKARLYRELGLMRRRIRERWIVMVIRAPGPAKLRFAKLAQRFVERKMRAENMLFSAD
jgi:hypothetical protein